MKVNFWIADTCLPDYWQGSDLPYVQIAVDGTVTVEQFLAAAVEEIRAGGMQGIDDSPELFDTACRMALAEHIAETTAAVGDAWLYLPFDATLDDEYELDGPYAYVVFRVESYTAQDVLDMLWERVRDAVSSTWICTRPGPEPFTLHAWGEDEEAMKDAPGDSLCAWMDDVEARLGGDVADARAAMNDYCCFRDGVDAGFEEHEVDFVEAAVMSPLGVQL